MGCLNVRKSEIEGRGIAKTRERVGQELFEV